MGVCRVAECAHRAGRRGAARPGAHRVVQLVRARRAPVLPPPAPLAPAPPGPAPASAPPTSLPHATRVPARPAALHHGHHVSPCAVQRLPVVARRSSARPRRPEHASRCPLRTPPSELGRGRHRRGIPRLAPTAGEPPHRARASEGSSQGYQESKRMPPLPRQRPGARSTEVPPALTPPAPAGPAPTPLAATVRHRVRSLPTQGRDACLEPLPRDARPQQPIVSHDDAKGQINWPARVSQVLQSRRPAGPTLTQSDWNRYAQLASRAPPHVLPWWRQALFVPDRLNIIQVSSGGRSGPAGLPLPTLGRTPSDCLTKLGDPLLAAGCRSRSSLARTPRSSSTTMAWR